MLKATIPADTPKILLYGRFTYGETESLRAWGDRELILSRKQVKWFAQAYLDGGAPRSGPYLAPVEADLRGLPPAILIVGTLDPLLSDAAVCRRAPESRRPCRAARLPGRHP